MILRTLLLLSLSTAVCLGSNPVYVLLFFHTEDYLTPEADDAAMRLARGLHERGIRASFQLVGQKARTLEERGRRDVIEALSHHDIGYHSDNHSVQPVPAVYLREMSWTDGADEFARREGPGVADIRRIFGVNPSCYSEPGSSWGPQSYRALVRMGIRVHIAGGRTVGLNEQPFWLGGMLQIYGLQRFFFRFPSPTGDIAKLDDTVRLLDRSVDELRTRGGGLIATGCHVTEFVTTAMWDSSNVAHGAMLEPGTWRRPGLRSKEDSERRYQLFFDYVDRLRKSPGVEFVTARDLDQLYEGPVGKPISRRKIADHMAARQTFLESDGSVLSSAEMLLALLGIAPQEVEGPVARHESTYRGAEIPRWAFERAKTDMASFIRANHRLPAEAWIGADRLSILDFAATLAADGNSAGSVRVVRGNTEIEKCLPDDPARSFTWAVHPDGFTAPALLELNRLQEWTLKPARFR